MGNSKTFFISIDNAMLHVTTQSDFSHGICIWDLHCILFFDESNDYFLICELSGPVSI